MGADALTLSTQETNYQRYVSALGSKVKTQFVGNPTIKFMPSSNETLSDGGIDFDVRLITSLAQKPTLASNQATQAKKSEGFDPFVPPFEPGMYLAELSPTHRLLFNKF